MLEIGGWQDADVVNCLLFRFFPQVAVEAVGTVALVGFVTICFDDDRSIFVSTRKLQDGLMALKGMPFRFGSDIGVFSHHVSFKNGSC